MNKKDINQIKLDLGLCADSLISIFLGIFIHKLIGIIYFLISLIANVYNYVKDDRKWKQVNLKKD